MKRSRKVIFFAAVSVVSLAVISTVGSKTVRAAVATLIQNIDEPGRNPYHQAIIFGQDSGSCTPFVCTVNFPAVPAGKRLVVTYASAYYSLASGGAEQNVSIGANGNFFSDFQYLAAPSNLGFNRVIVGGPITYYVDAGNMPSLFLGGNQVSTGSLSAEATIAGYLISAP
ncbi:MAG TPA: hypothetical protein VGK48_09155 [Terriglobia bacterium]|jgi:hypothetical protein